MVPRPQCPWQPFSDLEPDLPTRPSSPGGSSSSSESALGGPREADQAPQSPGTTCASSLSCGAIPSVLLAGFTRTPTPEVTPAVLLAVQPKGGFWRGVSPGLATEVAAQETLLTGWLLKRCGGDGGGSAPEALSGLAVAAAGSTAQGLFWRRRFFELSGEHISYWVAEPPKRHHCDSASETATPPRGRLQVAEIDDVVVRGREVHLHFAAPQTTGRRGLRRFTLSLCASTCEEAAVWAEAVRSAAAARLHAVLPTGWDVGTMLSGNVGPVRRVVKVDLPREATQIVQHLVDHSFICKRTRDRGNQEVPLRLEVVKVMCVQNVAAWMAYNSARVRVRAKAGAGNAHPLLPEVLTATLESAAALGGLDEAANEQWLFHGTTVAAAQGITDSEFRMDLAGSHRGSMYGKAVYLAECSSKADEYSEAGEDGLCRMLLCRATLGSVLVERERHPNAPELELKCRHRHDSLCGDRWAAVGTFREFVLYDSSQVYPEYIIHYRRAMEGDLLQAVGMVSNDRDGVSRLVPHAARLAQTHPDPQVRYRISLMLGAHAATVVPALTECLKDETPLRRRTAALALGHIADFTSFSRASFDPLAEDAEEKQRANPVASAVPSLMHCLEDTSEVVRKAAAQALQQIGPAAGVAVPALIAHLSDPSEDMRCACANALERLGGEFAAPAVPALAALLQDANTSVQKAALAALGQLGPHAEPAVPAIIECLQSTSESVRFAAAAALEHLGPSAASSVPTLLRCLQDSNVGVRTVAATALGQLGIYVDSLAPSEALRARLLDSHEGVRVSAAAALGRLGCSSAVPALIESLKDPNEDVRKAAATALGQLRDLALPALPHIIKGLKDSNEDVRKAFAVALGFFGPNAAVAAPALIATLSDTNVSVRKAAAVSLGSLRVPSRGVTAALTERLKDPNDGVRKASFKSLEMLQRRRTELEALGAAEADEGKDCR